MNAVLALLGRVLMSAIFVEGGWNKLIHFPRTLATMGGLGVPLPIAAAAVAVAVELGGGLAVLLGLRTRVTALVLAVWCVATGFMVHYHPGDTNNMIHFMKNICMAGGFLLLAASGPGRFSLDRG